MKKMNKLLFACIFVSANSWASDCSQLPSASDLKATLTSVTKLNDESLNGGLGAPVWLTLLDSSGKVCAVVHSLNDGVDVTTQLALNHRVMAVLEAGTANGFSRGNLAISSGNLNAGILASGGELSSGMDGFLNFQLNPYYGDPKTYGTPKDPFIGKRIGGNMALPGGLALFDNSHTKVGAIGVSGDFRCTDHVIAWKVREKLSKGAYSVSNIPFGLSSTRNDALIQDYDATGKSASGFGFPACINNPTNDNDGGAIDGN